MQLQANPYLMGRKSGFNSYAAGSKTYGGTGRNNPTMGPISAEGHSGYAERDMKAKAMRNALLKRMQAGQSGRFASADYNRQRQV